MEPPPCVQNAMMKQDKKPFTYTPGGLDLSEIKSPRMARRIERNANYSGAPEPPVRGPPPANFTQLPPSALAAMNPQMHVQVFPSGPPPPRGGAPPPPPPPQGPPPPPPPPSQPLPTQKVVTGDNQVLERPDMTKIIPDNPMAMLRKTGGPKVKNTFVDEMYNAGSVPKSPPAVQAQPQTQPQPPQRWVAPQQASPRSPPAQEQPHWSPQVQEQPHWSPKPQQQQQQQQWSPPAKVQPEWVLKQQEQQQKYNQPIIIDRESEPIKTSNVHLGSLYIPPVNNVNVQAQTQPKVRAPSPPKRDSPQSPSTPTLKEAPRPWQKQQQSQDVPPWAKRENVATASPPPEMAYQQLQRFQQAPSNESAHPNAVYVTQPVVLQHPGPPPAQQQNRQQPQRPGGAVTPGTPGNDRQLTRQQSWGSNPAQSNAFKIIQRITNTEEDDEEDDTPITQHSARFPQQFPQSAADQMRKMKLAEGDKELMNRFKQVPRANNNPAGSNNRSPQVRTIPIQIERDDEPNNKPYVHPSQQTVPEPKKYTGSSIPSRSFKILQAMTAPDSCANASEANENYDPSSYNPQWGYDPYYPPPYYYNYYHPQFNNNPNNNPASTNNNEGSNDRDNSRHSQTPVPFWGYYPPPYAFLHPSAAAPNDSDTDNESNRNNTPVPPPSWGYYNPYYPPPATPTPKTPETNEDWGGYYSDWDSYYYYYGYPGYYSPYPFYGMPSTDSEDVNGYSSTDEMTHLGRRFSEKAPRIVVTPTLPEESESETETETEDNAEEENGRKSRNNGLQTIRSVKNIHTEYDNDDKSEDIPEEPIIIEENSDLEDEEEEEDDDSVYIVDADSIPHQLSVIFEESELSRSIDSSNNKRESSVLSDSTTIADRSDEDEEDSATVVEMRTPLIFSLSIDHNAIIDGDDREIDGGDVFASFTLKSPSTTPKKDRSVCRYDNEEDNQILENNEEVSETKKEEPQNVSEEEDWWGILNKNDDDLPVRKPIEKYEETKEDEEEPLSAPPVEELKIVEELESVEAICSPNSRNSSLGASNTNDDSSSSESSDSSSSEDEDERKEEPRKEVNEEIQVETEGVVMPSIQERIKALKESIKSKQNLLTTNTNEAKSSSVKDKVSAIEVGKPPSTKSSVKSFEEFSEEEEGDSGVTSDMSRHISDNEEFPELKKMTRYQRAATHSRLFKLLQEGCEDDDDEDEEVIAPKEDKFSKLSVRKRQENQDISRRDQLSLPLKNVSDESFSSSGITSPGSPGENVNEKLVSELVESMLKRKKGQVFRNIPKDKLQAAAKKILQEELDYSSTPDSSFLSPLRNCTENSTPAQTPQEFYNDYKQYYDSWSKSNDGDDEESYDILPSKAFRLLQEHSGGNKTGAIAGLLAKCPKVLSSKNVHHELLKLLDSNTNNDDDNPTNTPSESFAEATSAS